MTEALQWLCLDRFRHACIPLRVELEAVLSLAMHAHGTLRQALARQMRCFAHQMRCFVPLALGAARFDPASSSFAYVYLLLQQLRFRTD